ncbi:MAG: Hpt domain-containing protein [Lachnospiraceae bacterium]|nr:Hpt domain-containing protein [Lachnospiraceae bacterium]
MTLHEVAAKIDLDLERTFALFMGKEDMYVKYLRKFPDNARRLLIELEEAVKSENHEKIEAAAHGIKGVAANLGIRRVTEFGTALMLDIRENTTEKIKDHYPKLVEEAEKAISCIEELE